MPDTFNLPGRVLRLTLKKAPFEVMLTGEKAAEYRRPSDYIISRLRRDYDYVVFYNGGYTGGALPWFAAKFEGTDMIIADHERAYSNGLRVKLEYGDIIINLGPVVASGNLKATPTPSPSTR